MQGTSWILLHQKSSIRQASEKAFCTKSPLARVLGNGSRRTFLYAAKMRSLRCGRSFPRVFRFIVYLLGFKGFPRPAALGQGRSEGGWTIHPPRFLTARSAIRVRAFR
jgi:hypothetical protein